MSEADDINPFERRSKLSRSPVVNAPDGNSGGTDLNIEGVSTSSNLYAEMNIERESDQLGSDDDKDMDGDNKESKIGSKKSKKLSKKRKAEGSPEYLGVKNSGDEFEINFKKLERSIKALKQFILETPNTKSKIKKILIHQWD